MDNLQRLCDKKDKFLQVHMYMYNVVTCTCIYIYNMYNVHVYTCMHYIQCKLLSYIVFTYVCVQLNK